MSLIPNFAMLGNGPSVLMLHDADTDHLGFAPQVELLASQGYRAIAWDMPGYHRNPPPYGGYSLAALAATADSLLEAMKIGRAHIVGHGLGAMVAAEIALRYPTRVRSLTLVAGGPALDTGEQEHWVATRQRLLAECQQQACPEPMQLQRFAQQLVQLQAGQNALPEGGSVNDALAALFRRQFAAGQRDHHGVVATKQDVDDDDLAEGDPEGSVREKIQIHVSTYFEKPAGFLKTASDGVSLQV